MNHEPLRLPLALALGGLLLGGCAADGDDSRPLADGEFTGTSAPDEQGAYGQVTVEITGGDIVDAAYVTVQQDGSVKDEDYGTGASGEVANEDYYEKAQDAVAAFEVYAAQLVEVDDPDDVDVVSGATLSYDQFVEATKAALDAARDAAEAGSTGQE